MKFTNSKSIGLLVGFVGVVLFSTKAVLVKLAYQYNIDSISLLLLRMAYALPFYIGIAIFQSKKIKEKQPLTNWIWLFAFGFVGYYLASLFDFIGLVYLKAGLERVVLFVYPTLVIIFSRVFLKTRVTNAQLLAIALTYIGLVIAFYQEIEISSDGIIYGAFLIFVSAVCYAGYLVGSGWLIPKFGASVFTSYAMMVACVCVITHYFIINDLGFVSYSSEVYWISLAMAVFCTVMPSYLVSWAIKLIGAPNFSIIGSFGPISTILLANVLLSEEISGLQTAGTLVVILGVYLASRKNI